MTYTVTVTREGEDWLAQYEEEQPTAHTYASPLTALRKEIADAIILSADLPDDAHVEVVLRAGQGVSDDVAAAISLGNRRAAARRDQERLREDTLVSVCAMPGSGWSVRDVAGAVGLTPGRVAQLVA